ncbi:MAG: Lrp/AsnC family transcriptional regulator [Candidatus Micrarchaeota archaeon]|nr:Lrp/AsnC family transcriptional regulator [Candidatus Micrarchaeota archaeon]
MAKSPESPVSLDDKDLSLLEELEKNSRLSEKKLSRKTNIPVTTVHNRLNKLRESGVVRGYGVRLDYAKLGKPLTAYVLVKAASQVDQKDLLDSISKLPPVYETAMITGEFDILFKARVASMDELNRLVVQGLRKNRSVSETRTMISYETIEKN